MDIAKQIELEFSLKAWQVKNVLELIDGGNTIPFIARYRKEATGSLDDQTLRALSDRLSYLRNLEEQKEKVINSITEQELMTDEILKSIENAQTMTELEDIYRPFRPKRKTRASVAKAKGSAHLPTGFMHRKKARRRPKSLRRTTSMTRSKALRTPCREQEILSPSLCPTTRKAESCFDTQ